MTRIIAILILLFTLSGCSMFGDNKCEPVIKEKIVKVPVDREKEFPQPPELNKVYKHLPIQKLNKNSTPKKVSEAYTTSIQILKNEVIYRGMLLDTYRTEE